HPTPHTPPPTPYYPILFKQDLVLLPFVVWKRGKYYLKVDKNGTSEDCPNCGAITGKKALSERVHRCDSCGHIEPRNTASARVIENRGKNAVGLTVLENARGGDRLGIL
ncbi:zinc ribbon domain-containing protein, partial [Microcystis aeruginosa CS-564/01]|uniref:zinc ribbon domain-containing protein n=1 Tax=Microcystis aeruginosa TaxID=1126 RepID=UPI00232F685F